MKTECANGSPITVGLLFAVFGTFAFAGYYSDLLKPFMPDWLAVGIFVLPVAILVFVNWGEMPDRIVSIVHISAAVLFLLLAAGMEVGSFLDYRPEGLTLYRILAHLAWTFSWAGVVKEAYKRRLKT